MVSIAKIGVVVILFAAIIFHLLVILKVIPYSIVWGGRLKSDKQMYVNELVSILVTSFLLWVASQKAQFISSYLSEQAINVVFWIMVFLFALNTVGNLLSKSKTEKMVFTPLTLLMTVFCLIVLLG